MISRLDAQLDRLVAETAPDLVVEVGVGTHTAAALLVTAGGNPENWVYGRHQKPTFEMVRHRPRVLGECKFPTYPVACGAIFGSDGRRLALTCSMALAGLDMQASTCLWSSGG